MRPSIFFTNCHFGRVKIIITKINPMKRKLLLIVLSAFMLQQFAYADEGMWLINMLDKQLSSKMKSKGLKLAPNEIYNENGGALTDAIVALDGGNCSASIISPEGLLITNHHCAYGDIQAISTPDKNYLEEGFWAMNREQEIPIKGKTVTFLRKVIDVTDQTNKIIDSLDKAGPRGIFFMRKVSGVIEAKYKTNYEVSLESMWRGSKYYLYFYETYSDVRLVGAPPASVGAFGGETDNWGWPQHKGDFSLYRVYASKDGKPAEYSKDNVALKANRYLKVSAKGYQPDDLTMIIGYPGSTTRYMSSFELKQKQEELNPTIYNVRRAKLDVWEKYMEQDPAVRLMYADKYFSISNYTDYAKWENKCLERFKVQSILEAKEKELSEWIAANPERQKKYGNVLEGLKKGYEQTSEIVRITEYFRESIVRGAEVVGLGQRFGAIINAMQKDKKDSLAPDSKDLNQLMLQSRKVFSECNLAADRELFKVMLGFYLKEVPKQFYEKDFIALSDSLGGKADKIADYIYDKSVVTDPQRLKAFFSKKVGIKELEADPIMIIVNSSRIMKYNHTEKTILDKAELDMPALRTAYVRAFYEMQKEKGVAIYPDANSTMRLTYGTVGPIRPSDAIYYHHQSSTQGILEKFNPKEYDFKLDPKVKALLEKGDWGRWGEKGKLYVDFLTDNDITGGNSGSAIMNGKGELLGLAFDGNRESMAGGVYFQDGYNKCVNVDIRYILWIIDKYAGAGYLIDEMDIVK